MWQCLTPAATVAAAVPTTISTAISATRAVAPASTAISPTVATAIPTTWAVTTPWRTLISRARFLCRPTFQHGLTTQTHLAIAINIRHHDHDFIAN
jgi:hypothetical protein